MADSDILIFFNKSYRA